MFTDRKKLKRALTILLSLIALIAVSMAGITLSTYVKEVQLFSSGWIAPKYFTFDLDGSDGSHSLAPGEYTEYGFTVRNYDDNGTSQVALHVSIEIEYPAQLADTGTVMAELYLGGTLLASDTGSGTLATMGQTLPAAEATADQYTLRLTWLDSDMDYLGEMVSTPYEPSDINIRVSGYQ